MDDELEEFLNSELIEPESMDTESMDVLNTSEPTTSSTPASILRRGRKPAPKSEHKWTDDEVMKLIGLVEPNRVIWDFGTAGYSKTPIRDAAWRQIASEFDENINVVQMQTKWQNLRNQYRKEDAKTKQTKSGQATSSRQVKWRFFEAMAFVGAGERELSTISESNIILETVILFHCFQFN